ncbi:helix-turn-helix transcriptional regulator [Microvirga sp. CF3016]|uniref:helix-turn-helix transcriptional regulator n=1 Tax=Microvirga sp. CF3016 TaxID=3110181 RepID=UPI002E759AE7|nr:helix-turn-helix domain-containing protein [Microvirga sp. CF3016]MEE1612065.1 helix-turn-helix domain-containing protein [Microvirga sp. CF3016]
MNSEISPHPDALLTEAQVAHLLSISTRTLQAWRVRGTGPIFVKAGRSVRYRQRDLVAWMGANSTQQTTSREVEQ